MKSAYFLAGVGLTLGAIACSDPVPPASTSASGSGAPSGAAGAAGAVATSPVAGGTQTTTSAQAGNALGLAAPSRAVVDVATLDFTGDVRGNCDLHTNFADDHACIPAPAPDQGIQIHIGPSNYDDPAEVAKFIMHPGQESSECFTFRTPNAENQVYQTESLSGRAGTHHIITSVYSGDLPTGSFGPCGGTGDAKAMQIGSLPGASKAYMPRSKVAPEYAQVGRKVDAHSLAQADMHYFNFTDKDVLREVWINLYFPPKGTQITTYSDQIRGFGGLSWFNEPIPPGTDQVYKYECPIKGNGSIMNLLGHYHAHGKRFTAAIKRATGLSEKVFEMYNYLDPATFDYNSVTMNPAFTDVAAGAVSGILNVQEGDILQWECHIINDSNAALSYTNEVKTGEMCNIWGYSIGIQPIQCDIF